MATIYGVEVATIYGVEHVENGGINYDSPFPPVGMLFISLLDGNNVSHWTHIIPRVLTKHNPLGRPVFAKLIPQLST